MLGEYISSRNALYNLFRNFRLSELIMKCVYSGKHYGKSEATKLLSYICYFERFEGDEIYRLGSAQ